MTLVQSLLTAQDVTDTGIRFVDRRERDTFVSWGELSQRAQAVAGQLLALGLTAGDRVCLIYPTGPAFFDAFFGCWCAGLVPVPVYPPVRLGRLEQYHGRTSRMIRTSGARLVLTDGKVLRLLGPTIERATPEFGVRRLSELPAGDPTARPASGDDLGLVQFSSGTTVAPKPVALTHAALRVQPELTRAAILGAFPETDGFVHVGVSWLPLYHDMGLIGGVFPPLLHRRDLVLIGPEVFIGRPASWLRAVSRFGGTVSVAPNFAYGLCVDKIRDEQMEGVDLSRWCIAMNGAEPVAPRTLRAFIDRFAQWGFRPQALTPVYGLSEAALAVTFGDFQADFSTELFQREALASGSVVEDPDGVELVSVGRPLPGFDLEIRDEAGTPTQGVGRVWARGPSLMHSYFDDDAATERTLVNGWLDTGDLGFLRYGQLFLTGRAKDVLILRGRNHPPHEVEQAVDGVAGLRTGCTAAVSYLAKAGDTEQLVLFVEHSSTATSADCEAMIDACMARVLETSGLSCDQVVVLAPGSLPRTSSGKIRRQVALQQWLAGDLRPPTSVGALQLAGAMLRSQMALNRSRRRER